MIKLKESINSAMCNIFRENKAISGQYQCCGFTSLGADYDDIYTILDEVFPNKIVLGFDEGPDEDFLPVDPHPEARYFNIEVRFARRVSICVVEIFKSFLQ